MEFQIEAVKGWFHLFLQDWREEGVRFPVANQWSIQKKKKKLIIWQVVVHWYHSAVLSKQWQCSCWHFSWGQEPLFQHVPVSPVYSRAGICSWLHMRTLLCSTGVQSGTCTLFFFHCNPCLLCIECVRSWDSWAGVRTGDIKHFGLNSKGVHCHDTWRPMCKDVHTFHWQKVIGV